MSAIQYAKARVIWFDDESKMDGRLIASDFVDNAAEQGIIVDPFDSNTEGLAHLDKHYKHYDAIVLDAYGRIASGSEKAEDPEALGHANDALADLAIKHRFRIPFCIYSGKLDRLDQVTGRAPKFEKTNAGLDALLTWILKQADDRGVSKILEMHAEAFRVFDEGLLPDEKRWELVRVLQQLDSSDPVEIRANNALCRQLVEPVMKGLNILGENYLPSELLVGDRLNADGAIRYLTGQILDIKAGAKVIKTFPARNRIIPDHLGWMLYTIIKTPTFTGSHDYREKHTHYAHRATVNALCELLIWYHDLIMSKHKK